jgi:hypothetical protein
MMAIGYWSDDTHMNGYGKRVFEDKTTEGHWDNADFVKGSTSLKENIKSYNPNIHLNARRIEYKNYIKKPTGVYETPHFKQFKAKEMPEVHTDDNDSD